MKKYIYITLPIIIATVLTTVAFLFLFSVNSINSSTTTSSLVPLGTPSVAPSTSVIPALEDLPVGVSTEQIQTYYIAKVKQMYGSTFTALTDADIVGFGLLWCDAINLGMKPADVEERINEGAADNDDAAIQRAIVSSAVLYLCPNSDW